MPCVEHVESPVYADDGSLERHFRVWDVYDGNQAYGLVATAAGAVFEGRIRDSVLPNLRSTDFGLWEATYKYTLPKDQQDEQQPPNTDPPEGIIEFDTGGGSQHITVAKQQFHVPNDAPNVKKAIGVGRDGVEGCDIIVPKLTLGITKHFALSFVTGAYIQNLARLTGKMNSAPYNLAGSSYDAGELLFLGASGSARERRDWEIKFQFEASQNNPSLTVDTSIPAIDKKGHDFAWVMFKKSEDPKALIEIPMAVYVAEVYESANFQEVLGF